jgi:hypothetical protein
VLSIADNVMIGLRWRRLGLCRAEASAHQRSTAPAKESSTMTDTPSAQSAQAPSRRRRFNFEPRPIDPATRRRRIKVARAVCLVGRTKCSVTIALRATGLDHDHNAREDVCDLLDRRRIPRIRKGVRRVRFKETPSRVFETFIPRQDGTGSSGAAILGTPEATPSRRALAAMAAELMAVADPLGDETANSLEIKEFSEVVPRAPRPPIICASCGRAFDGNRNAKFCGGRCRIRSWRAQR